jgi:LacI family transcriptional regulator
VLCANDLMAIGALDAAREAGCSVPDDVAVVGFDDIEAASLVTPPLTTVQLPSRDIGETSARLLLERLGGSTVEPRRIVVPTRLIVRSSA